MEKSNLQVSLIKDTSQKGIWQYSYYLSPLPEEFRITLSEGNTPEIEIEKDVYLKREDQNPTGSVKDRGMAYLISWAKSKGIVNLALSSSGNSAISAAAYCQVAGIKLNIFVSDKIQTEKLEKIKSFGFPCFISQRPVSEAIKFAQKNKVVNLRPSIQPFGPEGYQTLAFEIAEKFGLIEDIFLPVSSGVTLVGLAKGFLKLGFLPRLHLCQSAFFCPLASIFDHDFQKDSVNLTTSLVARSVPLKKEILTIIKESKGDGIVVENTKIMEASRIFTQKNIFTSYEGALAFAAFLKAKKMGKKLGKTVCLLTGKKYPQGNKVNDQ